MPPGAAARDIDAAARDAAAAFGNARVADLPKGFLVLASRGDILTDAVPLDGNLTIALGEPVPDLAAVLNAAVHFRAVPSSK